MLHRNTAEVQGSNVKNYMRQQHRLRLERQIESCRAFRTAHGLPTVNLEHLTSVQQDPNLAFIMSQQQQGTCRNHLNRPRLQDGPAPVQMMQSNVLLRTVVWLYRMLVVCIDVILLFVNMTKEFYRLVKGVFISTPLKSVSGEIALVTGAGQGIGRELAFELAKAGAVVVCVDIREDTNLETVRMIQDAGSSMAFAYVCDVANREAVEELVKSVMSEVGDVSILINNAGVLYCRPFLHHSPRQIENIFQTNLMGQMWMTRAFLPRMLQKDKGCIVSMCSIAGHAGVPNMAPYSASKFGVNGLFESLRQELRQINESNSIHLMTVSPFIVDTGMVRGATIRFPGLLNIVSAKEAASIIVKNLRKRSSIVFIPNGYYYLHNISRLLPTEIQWLIMDFIDSGINVHYDTFDEDDPPFLLHSHSH